MAFGLKGKRYGHTEIERVLSLYIDVIRGEAKRFASKYVSYDELLSEGYYIFLKIWRRHKDKYFLTYLRKSIHYGLMRYANHRQKELESLRDIG